MKAQLLNVALKHKTCKMHHLVQCQQVEIPNVVLLRPFDPSSAFLLVDHLADVLAYERALRPNKTEIYVWNLAFNRNELSWGVYS